MSIRQCRPGRPGAIYEIGAATNRQGRSRVPGAGFHKLLLNFTWWVNRKDPRGKNIFQGGFLGMDNIGVFDRSGPLPVAARWSSPTARAGWRCTA